MEGDRKIRRKTGIEGESRDRDSWIDRDVDKIQSKDSSEVVRKVKQQFSRHGIPKTLVADNGPQFLSNAFAIFTQNWDIEHVISSPHHSQSNGKAKFAVKIFKTLMKKASVGKRDICLSILEWRNTPSSGMQASPVQRLMPRRTMTLIPTIQSEFRPRVQRNVPEKLMQKCEDAKHYYDRNAKELPEIESRDSIRMRTTDGLKPPTWVPRQCEKTNTVWKICNHVAPRLFLVSPSVHLHDSLPELVVRG